MNSSQHDELAQLFSQFQVSPQQSQQQQQQQQSAEPQRPALETDVKASEHLHFTSMHYTPTHHILPAYTEQQQQQQEPSSISLATQHALLQNSIDPTVLLPQQIRLFESADGDQRLRLLELWRIAPPIAQPLEAHLQTREDSSTSMEVEIEAARQRYEVLMMARRQQQRREEHGLDTHVVEAAPLSPIRGPGETAWPPAARMRAASILAAAAAAARASPLEAEPYMSNGYGVAALDPVYAAAAGLWQPPGGLSAQQRYEQQQQQHRQYELQQQQQREYELRQQHEEQQRQYEQQQQMQMQMQDQYGAAFQDQLRCHADWEAMNERTAREMLARRGGGGDSEMVM